MSSFFQGRTGRYLHRVLNDAHDLAYLIELMFSAVAYVKDGGPTIYHGLRFPLELSPDSHAFSPSQWLLVSKAWHTLFGTFCTSRQDTVTLYVAAPACVAGYIGQL